MLEEAKLATYFWAESCMLHSEYNLDKHTWSNSLSKSEREEAKP